jgi:hypothetical protein
MSELKGARCLPESNLQVATLTNNVLTSCSIDLLRNPDGQRSAYQQLPNLMAELGLVRCLHLVSLIVMMQKEIRTWTCCRGATALPFR